MFGGLHSPRPLPRQELLLEIARAFTPRVEACGVRVVLLDLRGLSRLWRTVEELGRALLEAAASHTIETQVAISFSRATALVLAHAHPGLTIVPRGGEAHALAPLSLTLLELPPEREELLRRWGLRTIGDVARLPATELAARFGPEGPRLVRLARGEDEGVLVRTPFPERFEMTLDLDWPVEGLEPLAFLLARVFEPLCQELVTCGRKAASITIVLGLVDGSKYTRTLTPALPSASPRTWRTLVLLDLEAHPPHDAVTRITTQAVPTVARETQLSLLDPGLPSPERLAETMARLRAWAADGRIGAPYLIDTHRPGGFTVGTFAPAARRQLVTVPAVAPRLALRVFRPPRLAEVIACEGFPAFVAASGVRGAVTACAGPWRASGDWWDVAWSRDEWDVALAPGGLFRLFFDRLADAWFVEGELD